MKLLKTIAILIFLCVSLVEDGLAQKSSHDFIAEDPNATLPLNSHYSIHSKLLENRTITVFMDPADKRKRLYIQPYFLPDLKKLKSEYERNCSKGQKGEHLFSLEFELSSTRVNEEVVEQINKQGGSVKLTQLFVYPYSVLSVSIGTKRTPNKIRSRIIYEYPDSETDDFLLKKLSTRTNFPMGTHRTSISATCLEMDSIINEGNFSADIYSVNKTVRVNATFASLQSFLKSGKLSDLIRREKAHGSIFLESTTTGNAAGINLGFLAGSVEGGKVSSAETDYRRRFVNSKIIQDAVFKYKTEVNISGSFEFDRNDDAMERLFELIKSKLKQVEMKFSRNTQNQWVVTNGEYTRTLSKDDVDRLLEAKFNPNFNLKDNLEYKEGKEGKEGGEGGEVKIDKSMDYTDGRDIKWTKKGEDWVPTSVILYALDENSLKESFEFGSTVALVEKSEGFLRIPLSVIERAVEPEKHVTLIQGGIYKTIAYWSGGKAKRDFSCLPTPSVPNGYTRIGGEDIKKYNTRNSKSIFEDLLNIGPHRYLRYLVRAFGCKQKGFCDSYKEHCVSYERSSGCIINNKWLDWYNIRQEVAKLPKRIEDICRK